MSYERDLRKQGGEHLADCGNAELKALLLEVHARRAARGEALNERLTNQLGPSPKIKGATPSQPTAGNVLAARHVGSSVLLQLERPSGFHFRAGQSVKLGLPGDPVRHSYSIASAPSEPALDFCIEAVPQGRLSPGLFAVKPGDRVEIGDKAKGELALDRSKRKHLMIATVTGIAPLRSMLREALAGPHEQSEFSILHGASYAEELPYQQEFSALGRAHPLVTYLPSISRPEDPRNRHWSGQRGRVDTLVVGVLQGLGPPTEVAVYACGNPGMIDSVKRLLAPLGYQVLSEAFG